ncbi:MAG TPA: YHYH protein, partial [Isosphaeraceae bacterium]|nr:YHYH protein [Isosphaeraceae bacterium]
MNVDHAKGNRMRAFQRAVLSCVIFVGVGTVEAQGQAPGTDSRVGKPPPSAVLDSADGLRPIGGRWYLREGNPPTYVFKDADTYVDLFRYHLADSNRDGIPNLSLHHDATTLMLDSQGYPNHPTAIFPNSGNPNRIRVQNFHFRLPIEPRLAAEINRVPMGPIGVALNGVVFFNPFEAGGMNAVEGYSEVWLDSCCGHPEQRGVYHYHKYPSCVKSPFTDDGRRHSPVLGFAFDGFPIHGPYEAEGVMAKDLTGNRALDVCNGHTDPDRGYHYHVTPGRFPYIIGGYAGVPEPSNSPLLARARTGAIVDNADRSVAKALGILSVTPGNATRGQTHTLRFELDPTVRGGLPDGDPSWVQVGPFEATIIHREGNTISAEIAIASDAPLGVLLDAHMEFGKPDDVTSGPVR